MLVSGALLPLKRKLEGEVASLQLCYNQYEYYLASTNLDHLLAEWNNPKKRNRLPPPLPLTILRRPPFHPRSVVPCMYDDVLGMQTIAIASMRVLIGLVRQIDLSECSHPSTSRG